MPKRRIVKSLYRRARFARRLGRKRFSRILGLHVAAFCMDDR